MFAGKPVRRKKMIIVRQCIPSYRLPGILFMPVFEIAFYFESSSLANTGNRLP
jgi:hypothetical protein